MKDDDQKRDEVLKRLLQTPPQPKGENKEKKGDGRSRRLPASEDHKED